MKKRIEKRLIFQRSYVIIEPVFERKRGNIKMNSEVIELASDTTTLMKIRRKVYFFIKRTFDLITSIIGLICILPLVIIVKIMYVCTGDFKSVFYTHTRDGKNGKELQKTNFIK